MPTDAALAMAPVERRLLPWTATVEENGHLRVGEIDVLDLAAEFGTPLFVYDEYHLRRACREAVSAWGDGVAYAAKAFLCRGMARLAHEEGMHLDVASGGELHVALSAGVPADRLLRHQLADIGIAAAAGSKDRAAHCNVVEIGDVDRANELQHGHFSTPLRRPSISNS